jgi:F0F1-type ATP synthase membrane subunit c/vacuolar-type H+-ATPase subunit K
VIRKVFGLFLLVLIGFGGLALYFLAEGKREQTVDSSLTVTLTMVYACLALAWILFSKGRISAREWSPEKRHSLILALTLSDSIAMVGLVMSIMSYTPSLFAVSLVLALFGLFVTAERLARSLVSA